MGVPEEIRKVKRPVNTVVVENKSGGPKRWAVRERAFVTYEPGKNPQPHNGKTVGHIINGVYVPVDSQEKPQKTASQEILYLQYGYAAMIQSVAGDILKDLKKCYSNENAETIVSIAALRIMFPNVLDSHLERKYRKTWLMVQFPGLDLSADSIEELFDELGGDVHSAFFTRRRSRMPAHHHIAIEFLQMQKSATGSNLDNYTNRELACEDTFLLLAYDMESGEPICADSCHREKRAIDVTIYEQMLRYLPILDGILVENSSISPGDFEIILQKYPYLHYFAPIQRTDPRIKENNMLVFEGAIQEQNRVYYYCKRQIGAGKYLYVFKDVLMVYEEERRFGEDAIHSGYFDADKFEEAMETFGIRAYESDVDLKPEAVLHCMKERWKREMILQHYKPFQELDRYGSLEPFALRGSEFINFIASLITLRLLERYEEAGLLSEMTFWEVGSLLQSIWRRSGCSEPVSNDEDWLTVSQEEFAVLEKLGLSKPKAEMPESNA